MGQKIQYYHPSKRRPCSSCHHSRSDASSNSPSFSLLQLPIRTYSRLALISATSNSNLEPASPYRCPTKPNTGGTEGRKATKTLSLANRLLRPLTRFDWADPTPRRLEDFPAASNCRWLLVSRSNPYLHNVSTRPYISSSYSRYHFLITHRLHFSLNPICQRHVQQARGGHRFRSREPERGYGWKKGEQERLHLRSHCYDITRQGPAR
jgi:hypothetical protein